MSRDPFEVLGVAREATWAEVREAYRRTVELFHPDRLVGVRDAVRAEAERRLAEANEAMRAAQTRFGRPLRAPGHEVPAEPTGPGPSDEATRAEARLYDAQLRELDEEGAYVPGSKVVFGGAAAERVLAVLRHEFRRDAGPIRMVDWGSYCIELDGDEMRTFLTRVLGADVVDAASRPALGERLPVVVTKAAVPVALADAVVHLRSHVRYSLTADVY